MKIKKTILTASFVLTMTVCSLSPTFTVSASNQVCSMKHCENSVAPRSSLTEWVYKVENGKIYKRLYNASTATWLSDWTYVGEYKG